jgi:hypothetical protein
VTSSFDLRFVEWPLEESGDCFKFVYDGTHLVTGRDAGLPHEDLVEKLEVLVGHEPDRASLTLGWIWVRAEGASYSLAYADDRNPDVELQLEKWLSDGGPDDVLTDPPPAGH